MRSLRDKLAADMVVLVSEDSDCVRLREPQSHDVDDHQWHDVTSNTDAYAVVYSNCLSRQTLATSSATCRASITIGEQLPAAS